MFLVASIRSWQFIACLALFPFLGFSQPDSLGTAFQLKKRLLTLVDNYMPSVGLGAAPAHEEKIASLFTSTLIDSVTIARENLSTRNQKFILADKGLRAAGSYTDNFIGGFEDLSFFYRRAFSVGVDWNILKEGYFENKYSAKQVHFQDKLNLTMSKQTDASSLNWVTSQINRSFDKDIATKKRFLLQYVSDYEKIVRDLFLNRFILWEDLLKLKAATKELEVSLFAKDPLFARLNSKPVTFVDSLSVFQVNEPVFYDYLKSKTQEDSLVKISALVNQYKYPFWREINLRPYVRYNYYAYDINSRRRDFFSAGLMLVAPLIVRKKSRENLIQAVQNEVVAEARLLQSNNQWLADQYLSAYRNRLTEYTNAFHNGVLLEEQLRRESVKREHNDPDFSPLPGLTILKEWFENDISKVVIKKEMYLLLAKLSSLTNNASPADFVTVFVPEYTQFKPEVKRDKSIYVWSHGFAQSSSEEFVNEMVTGGYSRVIVSLNRNDSLKLKALDVIGILAKKNIEVHLMIANNDFVYPQNHDKLLEALKYNLSVPGIAGIHLDIEPHTLPEWKENKEEMYRNYVEMIEVVSSQLSSTGLALSVSIPLSYELEYLQKVNRHIDRFYLMAYEHPDVEFILRKTLEEVSLFQSKATIALRTKDFESMNEMEDFMEKLAIGGGFASFAIHDYSGLLRFKK